MQSWEAKVVVGAEQNHASNSFSSQLVKRFKQLLANLSIIIGRTCARKATTEPFFKWKVDNYTKVIMTIACQAHTHTHANRNYKAETYRREKSKRKNVREDKIVVINHL
jgi:hypothetical protein